MDQLLQNREKNIEEKPQEIRINQHDENLFSDARPQEQLKKTGQDKLTAHPEKTDWLDSFGTEFKERIVGKSRKEKQKNASSRLFHKKQNETLIDKAESEYAGRLTANLRRHLPEGVNPLQTDARDLAQFMIFEDEEEERNKNIAGLYFSSEGDEAAKKENRRAALSEMAFMLMRVDISKLHLESDQEIAIHAEELERLTGQISAFDSLASKNAFFDSLEPEYKRSLTRKLESLRSIAAYYTAQKEVMRDPLYRDHYNDEITYNIGKKNGRKETQLAEKLMRSFVLGRIMMKLNGVSAKTLNRHTELKLDHEEGREMYQRIVNTYGKASKQKEIVRAEALRNKQEKLTGIEGLTLDDFQALISNTEEGEIYFNKKGLHVAEKSTQESRRLTVMNLRMKEKLLELIRERMHVEFGSAEDLRLRLVLGAARGDIEKGYSGPIEREGLRIAFGYMYQNTSVTNRILDQGKQASPLYKRIADVVKKKIAFGYDKNQLAYTDKAQSLALKKQLLDIVNRGEKLGLPVAPISEKKIETLIRKNLSVYRDEVFRQILKLYESVSNLQGGMSADIKKILADNKAQVTDHMAALVLLKLTSETESARASAEIILNHYTRKLAFDLAGDNLTSHAQMLMVGDLSRGGSEGLEDEVEARHGKVKKWKGKESLVSKGTWNLTLLCNAFEDIARLEKKAVDQGLSTEDTTILIDLAHQVEDLLADEDRPMNGEVQNPKYGLMSFVADELSGTRFKTGFKDALKRFRESKNGSKPGLGFVASANRIVGAAYKIEDRDPEPELDSIPKMDIQTDFNKTDRVKNYLKYFKGTKLEIARFFAMMQTPSAMIESLSSKKTLKRDLFELRELLGKMSGTSAARIRLAGVEVGLVRDGETMQITIGQKSLAMPYNAEFLIEKINSDICERSDLYGSEEALAVLQPLHKDEKQMTPGDVGRLRQRCLSVLKHATGKNAGFFSNISHEKLYDYATAILDGRMKNIEIIKEVNRIENTSVEKVNAAETLAFLHRTETNPLMRVVATNQIKIEKSTAEAAASAWTQEELRVKNFIADMLYGEESWNTNDKYIKDDTKTGRKGNRETKKKSRIFDMLMPKVIGENKNLDTFILMINKPELIRATVEKMALPGEDIVEEAGAEKQGGLKAIIINNLESVVLSKDMDEIRNTEGSFLMSKETIQKGKLATGLSIKAEELKTKFAQVEEDIDASILGSTKSFQKEIEKVVDKMFDDGEELTWAKVPNPSEGDLDIEEQKQCYEKLMEVAEIISPGFRAEYESVFIPNNIWSMKPLDRKIRFNNLRSALSHRFASYKAQKKKDYDQMSPLEGTRALNNIIDDATKGRRGQGLFTKLVMKNYFMHMPNEDKRRMFASAIRNSGVSKKVEDFKSQEAYDAYEEEVQGNFLGGVFKGAGPLLQKMLQGLPENSLPLKLKLAVKDMKSNLMPIPDAVVTAELSSLVDRSHKRLTKLDVVKSLGAASVGQAFLCKAYGPNLPEDGKQVVVKLLRPDARNRMEREKTLMQSCAAMTDETGGMLATYKGQLKRFEEEVDLTIEARNVVSGQIYDNGAEIVQAMKLSDLAEPTESAMIVEMAPGTTVDKFIEEVDQKKDEALSKFYVKKDDGTFDKENLKITAQNVSEHGKARAQLIALKNSLERKQTYIVKLAEKWVTEGIYGAGFYHGDLHAGNIMIDDKCATVIDFGNCTQLTKKQQEQIMLMMTSATFMDPDGFLRGFHALLENTPEQFYKENETKLRETFGRIMRLGTEQDVGQRILAALIKAQELGFEMPAAVFNFSQAQQRLHNTIEDMNAKLQEVHRLIDKFDRMEVEHGADPILTIMKDQKMKTSTQDVKVTRLHEMKGILNPDSSVILKDYNSMSAEKFEDKYLQSQILQKTNVNLVNAVCADFDKMIEAKNEGEFTHLSMTGVLFHMKTTHVMPFADDAVKLLPTREEEEDFKKDISAPLTNLAQLKTYNENLKKWIARVKELDGVERKGIQEAYDSLKEIKEHPENFTEEEKTEREKKLVSEYTRKLRKKTRNIVGIDSLERKLYRRRDRLMDDSARESAEKGLEYYFADKKWGEAIKKAYDDFRKLQQEKIAKDPDGADSDPEVAKLRENLISLVENSLADRIQNMISEEPNHANTVPKPKTFFDMMGEVLGSHKLASFRRLGIFNLGRLVTSGRLGFVEAIKGYFSA